MTPHPLDVPHHSQVQPHAVAHRQLPHGGAGACSYCSRPSFAEVKGHPEPDGTGYHVEVRRVCGSCAIAALDATLRPQVEVSL